MNFILKRLNKERHVNDDEGGDGNKGDDNHDAGDYDDAGEGLLMMILKMLNGDSAEIPLKY